MILTDDCLEKVFDYIALEDLCSVGQTCKRFHNVAGRYFTDKYPTQTVWLMWDKGRIQESVQFIDDNNVLSGCDTNFARYAREFLISGGQNFHNDFEEFRYAASVVGENVKVINFQSVEKLAPGHDEYVKKTVENVENIGFMCCFREDGSYADILKHCKNLINLSIELTDLNMSFSTLEGLQWYNRSYPNYDNTSTEHLKNFLKQNLHIKKLTTDVHSLQLLNLIEELGLKLCELGITLRDEKDDDLKVLCVRLNDLHERGFFKQIKLGTDNYDGNVFRDNIDQIQQIRALHTITDDRGNFDKLAGFTAAFATLSNLKQLSVGFLTADDFELLSQGLVNLERLHLETNSLDDAIPFIRRLSKLEEVIIGSTCHGTKNLKTKINIKALNDERQMIPHARKVTVYLLEREYLRLKWTQNELNYGYIEIKREQGFFESSDL